MLFFNAMKEHIVLVLNCVYMLQMCVTVVSE